MQNIITAYFNTQLLAPKFETLKSIFPKTCYCALTTFCRGTADILMILWENICLQRRKKRFRLCCLEGTECQGGISVEGEDGAIILKGSE